MIITVHVDSLARYSPRPSADLVSIMHPALCYFYANNLGCILTNGMTQKANEVCLQ